MSAVTLETLRADYAAALRLLVSDLGENGTWRNQYKNWLRDEHINEIARLLPDDLQSYTKLPFIMTLLLGRTIEAARVLQSRADIFVIERDHGLNAAMLYKLSDGAIDPRVSA